jgi:hypothetical protein
MCGMYGGLSFARVGGKCAHAPLEIISRVGSMCVQYALQVNLCQKTGFIGRLGHV